MDGLETVGRVGIAGEKTNSIVHCVTSAASRGGWSRGQLREHRRPGNVHARMERRVQTGACSWSPEGGLSPPKSKSYHTARHNRSTNKRRSPQCCQGSRLTGSGSGRGKDISAGRAGARRQATPPAQQSEPPYQAQERFSEWFGGKDGNRARGQEKREAQWMPRNVA